MEEGRDNGGIKEEIMEKVEETIKEGGDNEGRRRNEVRRR